MGAAEQRGHHRYRRIATALLTGLGAALCTLSPLAAQISPGALSKAHQSLEGITRCGSCHDFQTRAKGLKCAGCHTEIQRRLDAGTGYHARAINRAVGSHDCARCHSEHSGEKFALVRLDRKTFDHAAATGFRLEGLHSRKSCESCHNARNVPQAARGEIRVKDLNRSFLGLRRECASCHQDRHQGQLGNDCARCHTQAGWKPASGFTHQRARFQLTGRHVDVPCVKCHAPKPGSTALQFSNLSFGSCQSCHNDPHKRAFAEANVKGGCDTCHNTRGWKNAQPDAVFSHQQTNFALNGKHAQVPCIKCHKDVDFRRPLPHARCGDCHQDAHDGQFSSLSGGGDCATCHNQAGFKPSLFDRQAHKRSAFPLEGRHAPLACEKCHQPALRKTRYKTGLLRCAECHVDAHAGQFVSSRATSQCDACHTDAGFDPPVFSLDRHQQTRFPLAGKHATTACRECHKPLPPEARPVGGDAKFLASKVPSTALRQFHFEAVACENCHKDPHQTRRACDTCHQPAGWKRPADFNHAATGFALEGEHQKVACTKCHKNRDQLHSMVPGFAQTPAACSACHQDRHGGQFQTGGRVEECGVCHTPARWTMSGFNHDLTQFPLDRAHRFVTCGKCHKQTVEVNGKSVPVYRGTPMECVKCH